MRAFLKGKLTGWARLSFNVDLKLSLNVTLKKVIFGYISILAISIELVGNCIAQNPQSDAHINFRIIENYSTQ